MLTIDYSVRCRKEKVTDELKALVGVVVPRDETEGLLRHC